VRMRTLKVARQHVINPGKAFRQCRAMISGQEARRSPMSPFGPCCHRTDGMTSAPICEPLLDVLQQVDTGKQMDSVLSGAEGGG